MNREQFILGKIAEEAGEITQIAIKSQQHGLNTIFYAQELDDTCEERLVAELNDLLGVVGMLHNSLLDKLEFGNLAQQKRVEKVEYWLADSIKEGFTEDGS